MSLTGEKGNKNIITKEIHCLSRLSNINCCKFDPYVLFSLKNGEN